MTSPDAPLDPALCRTMANVVRRLPLTFDDKERIAEQLTAAADLADRKPLTEERVREVVKRVAAEVLGKDHSFGGDPMRIATRAAKELAGAAVRLNEAERNHLLSIRAVLRDRRLDRGGLWEAEVATLDRLLSAPVVDPTQRDADLREAFLAGFERCRQDGRLTAAVADDAAEYARTKAGG